MHILDRFKELEESYYLDSLSEAEEDGPETASQPPVVSAASPPLPEGDPAMAGGMDPSMAGGYGDPSMGMGGMPPEEIKTPTQLGRIYELNKIYYRLYTVHMFLKNSPDPGVAKLRNKVNEAFDIYRLILNNIKSYTDKIDSVILIYYEFLSRLVLIIEQYYKKKQADIEKTDNS